MFKSTYVTTYFCKILILVQIAVGQDAGFGYGVNIIIVLAKNYI